MKYILIMIAANLAPLAFLGFTIWCLLNSHLYFGIASFIIAASSGKTLKSYKEE